MVGQKRKQEIIFGPEGYDFGAPEPLPEAAKIRAQALLESGRLFRYQGKEASDVADLEREFTKFIGLPHSMACNSGGCAIFLSLKALGVQPGDKVLLNAWTLAPVPGAIVHACATPVFVGVDREELTIDIEDLEAKAKESGAKVLVLSYMRGQVPDMDKVMAVVKRCNLRVVEDCAHTLGGKWQLDGESEPRHLGAIGDVGTWSFQTNKSINCGEGGMISTARQDLASYLTVATGSYGHYGLNGASGDPEKTREIYTSVPNMSMRLSSLTAAIALPQLEALPKKLVAFQRHARKLHQTFKECPHIRTLKQEHYLSGKLTTVLSSMQFALIDFSSDMIDIVLSRLSEIGIPMAWFGGPCKGFTSTLRDWKFADPSGESWNENIEATLSNLVDLPLYHTSAWSDEVIQRLAELVIDVITSVAGEHCETQ